jgi:hypothetical protein
VEPQAPEVGYAASTQANVSTPLKMPLGRATMLENERMSALGQSRRLSDVGMSASPPIVLQKYFELPSEEIFFKIAHQCGILIQETARSDSILARFRLIHCSRASFATQSPQLRTYH